MNSLRRPIFTSTARAAPAIPRWIFSGPTYLAIAALLFTSGLARAQVPTQPDSGKTIAPGVDSTAAPAVADSATVVTWKVRSPLRVCAGGDVTLGTNLDTAWARRARARLRSGSGLSDEPDSLLFPLRPLLADADVVILNVEGAIGEGDAPSKCSRNSKNCYAFRQPVTAARALRAVAESASVVGNVANNHAHDAGGIGLRASLRHLRDAGVYVTGNDTLATPVVTPRGDTIGVLGFYTSSATPDVRDLPSVRRHVRRAVERYGTVVVTMHLGAEGASAQRTRDTTEIFLERIDRGNPVAFADAAIESGATLVVGHGPHVLRAAEWRGDRLVFYSLGNLLTYGPFSLSEPMNRGAIACATIDSAGYVSSGEIRSTLQLAPGVLRADPRQRAAWLVDSLSALDFPETGAIVGPTGEMYSRTAADSLKLPAVFPIPPL